MYASHAGEEIGFGWKFMDSPSICRFVVDISSCDGGQGKGHKQLNLALYVV